MRQLQRGLGASVVVATALLSACGVSDLVIGTRGQKPVDVQDEDASLLDGIDAPEPREPAPPAPVPDASLPPSMPTVPSTASYSDRSPGCGLPASDADTAVAYAGGSVRYLLDLPRVYDPDTPYPLVLAFHASQRSAEDLRAELDLGQVAGDEAIVVHPEGTNGPSTWDMSRDLPYFDALLNQLLSRHCVNPARVFVVGHGAGALFGSALACARARELRAVALYGTLPPIEPCQSPISVLIGQGTRDVPLRVDGAADARDYWVEHNGCDVNAPVPVSEGCVEYRRCQSGSVRYCQHDGDLSLPPSAARIIWDFFTSA